MLVKVVGFISLVPVVTNLTAGHKASVTLRRSCNHNEVTQRKDAKTPDFCSNWK